MGNKQENNKQTIQIEKNQEINHNELRTNETANFSQDLQSDVGINIQFIERREFKCSTQLTASKNLMQENIHAPMARFGCPADFEQVKQVDQLLNILVIPLSERIIKKSKRQPQFQIVKIDFKKFVAYKQTNIKDQYQILEQIGDGSYGIVYRAQLKVEPGEFRAVKKITKKLLNISDKSQLNNEFEILKKCDHPNILKIFQIYEDSNYYFVVSQLCSGGNLLTYINHHNLFQCELKFIMIQILGALKYLHNHRILHRDIKLQNVLIIQDKTKNPQFLQIKIIDFGLSVDLSTIDSPITDEMAGTLLYMAPEGLYGQLNLKSDIWSCGVILYMLLTKHVPFKFKDQEDLMNKIQKCKIVRKHIQHISLQAKTLLFMMLEVDTNRRYSADRALQSDWLKSARKPSLSISQKKRTASQIYSYNIKNNLISMVESFIAFRKINQVERQKLATIFAEIDKDKSGGIDKKELKSFLSQNLEDYNQKEIEELIKAIDKNQSGFIDFTEFLIAMQNKSQLFMINNLKEAFDFFDVDGSGNISKKEVKLAMSGMKNEQIEEVFGQFDEDLNEEISKNEFFKYFHTNQF